MSRNEHLSGVAFDTAMQALNVEGDEFDLRKFDPSDYGFGPTASPTEVLISCCDFVHVNCTGGLYDRFFTFFLFADGACPGNGTPAARASVGVYGRPGAWYNEGLRLPSHLRQTNQSAEIYSAIAAIKVARDILEKTRPDLGNCGCPSIFVLVMDSVYVVKAMTQWIRNWRANGFRDANGAPVDNAMAFQRLDHDIRQAFLDRFLVVRFWHVNREYNVGADRMAAQALQSNRFLKLSP